MAEEAAADVMLDVATALKALSVLCEEYGDTTAMPISGLGVLCRILAEKTERAAGPLLDARL